jgi:membrane protein DedA with SNARE-associated domain
MTTLFFIYSSFAISVIEEIFFVIPSTLAQMAIGGFMLEESINLFNFIYFVLFLVLPASLGVAVGSIPIFLIVKYSLTKNDGKSGRLQKIINKVKESSTSHEKGSIAMFFLMRLLPNFSGLVATIIGGLWSLPMKNFFIFTFLGSIIRITILGLIGWQASNYIYIFTGKYGLIGFSSGIIFILALSTLVFYKKKKNVIN